MLKKLLIVALLKKLILLAALLIWNSYSAQAVSIQEVTLNHFPSAEKSSSSNCYLLRLDDCEVTAVKSGDFDLGLVLVRHKNKKEICEATAKRFLQYVPGGKIVPFAENYPAVAIIYPAELSAHPARIYSPDQLLLTLYKKKTLQFLSWQNKNLKVRIEGKPTMELTLNLGEINISSAEFRVTKGGGNRNTVRDLLKSIVCPGLTTPMPTLTQRGKKDLNKLYNNQEVLAYNSVYDFCIVNKGKIYRVGSLDGVKDALRSSKRESVAFTYPAANAPWPDNTPGASGYTYTKQQYGQSHGIVSKVDKAIVQKAEKESILISELQKKFPAATPYPSTTKHPSTLLFRLDGCRIIAHKAYRPNKPADIELIIVSSTKSQMEALNTAKRLAKILSPRCEAVPFAGSSPNAVIYMPGLCTLEAYLYSPLNLVLYPRPDYKKNTRFMRWENGMIVTEVDVDTPGAKGTVEVTFNPLLDSNYSGVRLRVLSGEVDIQHFLNYGYRMWGRAEKPTRALEESIKANSNCEAVISCAPDCGFGGYCLLTTGNNTYYCGSYKGTEAHDGVPKMLQKGFGAPPIPWPGKDLPWPAASYRNDIDVNIIKLTTPWEIDMSAAIIRKGMNQDAPAPTPEAARAHYLQSIRNY